MVSRLGAKCTGPQLLRPSSLLLPSFGNYLYHGCTTFWLRISIIGLDVGAHIEASHGITWQSFTVRRLLTRLLKHSDAFMAVLQAWELLAEEVFVGVG